LNSGLCTHKPGALSLEPLLQPILLWLFWRWGLENFLPRPASNLDPPNLSLPSSWDYRRAPWSPAPLEASRAQCVISPVTSLCDSRIWISVLSWPRYFLSTCSVPGMWGGGHRHEPIKTFTLQELSVSTVAGPVLHLSRSSLSPSSSPFSRCGRWPVNLSGNSKQWRSGGQR
jgi:hypothetical protein